MESALEEFTLSRNSQNRLRVSNDLAALLRQER